MKRKTRIKVLVSRMKRFPKDDVNVFALALQIESEMTKYASEVSEEKYIKFLEEIEEAA